MKRILFLTLFVVSVIGNAQTWKDVTDQYVVNPRFDGNDRSTGWEGTSFSAANPMENAEFWNYSSFNSYQTIYNLEPGRYRLSLDAFYRYGEYSDDESIFSLEDYSEYQYAKLYAETNDGHYEVPIVLLSSGASATSFGGGRALTSYGYVPNNMAGAYYWFEAGMYQNSVALNVGNDGYLKIGVYKKNAVSHDWICLDNWKLERCTGGFTEITGVVLDRSSLSLGFGEYASLSATVRPTNATISSVFWTSSNENVATVDAEGKVYAVGKGTTVITASAADGSGVSASCTVTVNYNAATEESMIINEIMASNLDLFVDPSWNYGGWIELYNPTDRKAILGGYWVSDDPANLRKAKVNTERGTIPAGGYLTLWFDHAGVVKEASDNYVNTQLDMKLDCEGGTIYISDADGNLIVSQDYPASTARCSYARTEDGGAEWGTTFTPTPGATNVGSSFATQRLDAPVVDTDGGLIEEGTSYSFRVTIPSGCTLRYTTDGSTPTLTNGMTSYSGTFSVSSTAIYRFCLFRDGYLPSPVVTRSFINKGHDYYLPIVSVVTNPDNLYDDEIGVYTSGSNGVSGNGQGRKNWNMDWERPVNMEYIVPDEDGEYCVVLNQECDFEVCGGWSRAFGGGWGDNGKYWAMRGSFRLKTDKKYELENSFDYPIFPNKQYNKYKVLQVRNGGNDTYARTKDAALSQIVLKSGWNLDVQDCQPAHVFLNGEYLGMLNIRESNNKHYGYSNFGIDTDDMDQFDLSNAQYNQKAGDDVAWLELVGLSKSLAQTHSEEVYNEICNRLDMDEYINYMALECYIGCSDWITNTNNVKGYRCKSDNGKFRFVMFDTDSSFDRDNMIYDLLNTGGGANVDDLFRNLIQYEPFRERFITAYCIVNGSVLDPDRAYQVNMDFYEQVNAALGFEGNGSHMNVANSISSAHDGWRMENMRSYFGLGDAYHLNLTANENGGKLLINGQEVPMNKFDGQIFAPITLTAKAPAGYRFKGWGQVGYSDSEDTTEEVFGEGSYWYYYDQGSLDYYDWKNQDIDVFNYARAPFGYAKDGRYMNVNANTILDYGSDSGNKRPTYYFMRHFNLDAAPSDDEEYTLTYQVDDGVRIHVNGTDIGGYHCNEGAFYSDYSTTYEADDPYVGTIIIPNYLLREGDNIIAVDVHNVSANSSDIYFEAKLDRKIAREEQQSIVSTSETFCLSDVEGVGEYEVEALFEPNPAIATAPVRVNEVSAGNDIYINDHGKRNDWVELYNTTGEDIDLGGMYLSDNARKPQKYQIVSGVNSVIPAHGYKIVWCDALESVSQLHAPFKLDNADGAIVSIQAEDGKWADMLEYREQARRQTYGRYPDGGGESSIMTVPSIEKTNGMTLYDASVFEGTSDDFTITLALAKGWNWTSHNLSGPVNKSRFTSYAQCLRSQTREAYKDLTYGWLGSLNELNEAEGYKIKMAEETDIVLGGKLYDVSVPVTVDKGWNWIGFPLYNATTISAALANYTPSNGDMVIGQNSFATYNKGAWIGSLTSLTPGQSYIMKVGSAQSFCWNSLSEASVRSRRYTHVMESGDAFWAVDIHAYPNVMNIIATVESDDIEGGCRVAAFAGEECRGVGEWVDGLLYMTVHGEGGEQLNFKVVDQWGTCYDAVQSLTLRSPELVGSNTSPYVFTINEATGVERLQIADSEVISRTYYNLSGQQISSPTTGVYVEKVIYRNGTAKKKLRIKN